MQDISLRNLTESRGFEDEKTEDAVHQCSACGMHDDICPSGQCTCSGGGTPENGVTAQEDTAAKTIPTTGMTITEGGNYEIPEGTYTRPIEINVTDTTQPVNIAIKGKVTATDKCDPFFNIKKAGIVNIENEGNYEVDCTTRPSHFMFISYSGAQVTVTNGKYKGSGGTHLMMNFSGSLTLNSITAQTESSYAITSAGTVIINGGTYTRSGPISSSTENGAIGNGGGTMELHDVTVNSCQVAVTNSNGELTIDGGNYTSDNGFNCIRNESAGLKIDRGAFDGRSASCINNKWGRVEINGGTITSAADYTIENRGGLHMNNGTVASTNPDAAVIDCAGNYGDTRINGGTIRNSVTGVRVADAGDSEIDLKAVTFENNADDISLGNDQQINIKKSFVGTAKIRVDDPARGRQITTDNEGSPYQKKLSLISRNEGYVIGYKKVTYGAEFRYLAPANGKTVNAVNAKATADLGAGAQQLDTTDVVPEGKDVTVTADLQGGAEFLGWSVSRADGEALDWTPARDDPQTITFTMPDCNVTVTALCQGGNDDIDNPSGGGSSDVAAGIAAVALTGAAVWSIYEAGTGIYRVLNMPGVPMPSNRAGLATLIWEKAGCPEPQTVKSFSDIDDADLHLRQAASWMEEQGLMDDVKENEFRPYRYVTKLQTCLVWDKAKEESLIS